MSATTQTSTDVFEIMQTTRSMRRLKPDPVPDALIEQDPRGRRLRRQRRQHAEMALPGGQGPGDQEGRRRLVQEGVR